MVNPGARATLKSQPQLNAAGRVFQECKLPVPPSVNNLYKSAGNRRVKTDLALAWIAEAVIRMKLGMRPVETYPVMVTLMIEGGKDNLFPTSRDVSNCEKVVTDALVSAGILKGDSIKHIWDNCQTYRPGFEKTSCWVTITEDVADEKVAA